MKSGRLLILLNFTFSLMGKSILKRFPAILLMCTILTGCDLVDGGDETELNELLPPENELIPLAVGNYWVYEQWHMEPSWLDTVRTEVLNVQDIIVENTKIRAYGTYRFRYDDLPREDALISLKANGPEGYYSLGFRIPTDSLYKLREGFHFKFPAAVGDTWKHTTVLFNPQSGEMRLGNTRTIELLNTSQKVETPNDDFENCYVYRFNDFGNYSTLFHHFYIKPEVGIVGVDTYGGDGLYGQWRLLEYELKKTP